MGEKKKEEKIDWRAEAIKVGNQFVEGLLKSYKEPVRAGTPKGEPIGMIRKKFHAAALMILWPKCFKLREIARIVSVSENVLRVWRTQRNFKEVALELGDLFGEMLAPRLEFLLCKKEVETLSPQKKRAVELEKRIRVLEKNYREGLPALLDNERENYIDYLVGVLPFYSPPMEPLLYGLIRNFPWFFLRAIRLITFAEEKGNKKDWISHPAALPFVKMIIEVSFKFLGNSKNWEKLSFEEKQKTLESIKFFILNVIDDLSK